MEARGRLLELLIIPVLIPVIIVVLIAIFGIDFNNIIQVNMEPTYKLIPGVYLGACLFSGLEGILFLVPKLEIHEIRWKPTLIALLAATGIILLQYVVMLGNVGVPGMKYSPYATINMMQTISVPFRILERFDVFMLIFLMVGLFVVISSYIFYYVRIAKDGAGHKRVIWLVLLFLIVAGIIAEFLEGTNKTISLYAIYIMWIDIPISVITPGVCMLFGVRRGSDNIV